MTQETLNRRNLLKRAIAAGGIVAAGPAIQSFTSPAGAEVASVTLLRFAFSTPDDGNDNNDIWTVVAAPVPDATCKPLNWDDATDGVAATYVNNVFSGNGSNRDLIIITLQGGATWLVDPPTVDTRSWRLVTTTTATTGCSGGTATVTTSTTAQIEIPAHNVAVPRRVYFVVAVPI